MMACRCDGLDHDAFCDLDESCRGQGTRIGIDHNLHQHCLDLIHQGLWPSIRSFHFSQSCVDSEL